MPPDESIPGIQFHALHRAHRNTVQAELAAHGLQQLGQPMILFILEQQGEDGEIAAQRELADALSLSPATIAMSLKSLERLGYVEKRADACDARRKRIAITPKGKAAVEQCHGIFKTVDERMFKNFTPEELICVRGFHRRMMENLGTNQSDRRSCV